MCLHCQQELSCKSRTVPLLKFAFWVLVSQYWKTVAGPLQGLGMFAETQFLWKHIQLQLRQICIKPWLTKLSSSPTWQMFHLSMTFFTSSAPLFRKRPQGQQWQAATELCRGMEQDQTNDARAAPARLPSRRKEGLVDGTAHWLRSQGLWPQKVTKMRMWMDTHVRAVAPIPQSNVKNPYERTLPHIQIEVFRTRTKASVFRPHGTGIQGFLPLPLRSKWSPCRILHQDEVECCSIQVHHDAWSWCPSAVQTSTWELRPCSTRLCHNCPWRLRDNKSWDWRSDKLANTCEK